MLKAKIIAGKKEIITFLFLFLFCLAISFSFYSKAINADNYNYAIEEIHAYDSSLYDDNINTNNAGFSPRFFANHIMAALITITGASWAGAAAILIRFNYVLFALAFSALAYRISVHNRFLIGAVVTVAAMGTTISSLGFNLNGAGDVFLGTAIPTSLLAISLLMGKSKQWFAAWVLLAVSVLLHVHEGIWGGCIVGLLWLACCFAEKKPDWKSLKGFPIYAFAVLAVILPSLANDGAVDNALFTEIYVFIRTPHHLLLSNWGKKAIITASILIVLPLIMFIAQKIKGYSSELFDRQKIFSIVAMLCLWILLLAGEFFITEIVPIATLITMYLPKCFKYVTFFAIVLYLMIADECFENKRYISALAVFGVILIPKFGVKVVCFLIFIMVEMFRLDEILLDVKKQDFNSIFKCISYFGIAIYIYIIRGKSNGILFAMLFLILYEFVFPFVKYKLLLRIGTTLWLFVCILYIINGQIFYISREGISYVSGTECLKAGIGEDIWQLGVDFKNACSENITFLSDPDDGITGSFQLASEKNCYASYKNTPSSKSAIIEWYDRILSIRGITDMEGDGIAALLDSVNLEYVLVRSNQFEALENSELFDCIVKNDTAGVYKLK